MQRADAEAAKLYQEFEQFFGDSRDGDSKSFVRGGTIQPGSRPNLEGRHSNAALQLCGRQIYQVHRD